MTGSAEPQEWQEWQVDPCLDRPVDPLLGSLGLLCTYYGNPCSELSLTAGLPLADQQLTPELLPRAAERAGLTARLATQSLADVATVLLPAIVLLKQRRACVLLKIEQQRALVLLPEAGAGEQWLALAELEQSYSGHLFYVKKDHRFDARSPELLAAAKGHWFWDALKRNRPIYRDVGIASLLINLFAVASPLFVMNVYDRVVPNLAFDTLWVLAFGIFIVFSFDFFLRQLRAHFIDLAGKKTDLELSSSIFSRVMNMKLSARPESVGSFANQLQSFEHVREFITSATVGSLIDLPFALLFLLVIWLVAGPLVIIPLVAMLLMAGYALYVQRPMAASVEKAAQFSAQKHGALVENLAGMEAIRMAGAQGQVQERWERNVSEIGRHEMESRRLAATVSSLSSYLQQIVTVAVVVFGVYLIAAGQLSLGGIIAASMLGGRAIAPMAQLAMLATRYNHFKASMTLIDQVMATPEESDSEHKYLDLPRIEGAIEFDRVSFRYPHQEIDAIGELSFSIKPGEKVAIIGRIGAGKSTLSRLLLDFYDPGSGSIRVDGVNINQIHPADLRRNIGCVSQETQLFYGTIRDNILLGAPYCSDEHLRQAADFGGVLEFTDHDPQGFERQVGEAGRNLSGGQRQAVALARAMLLDPPILLMDEPTSQLDNRAEQIFIDRLKNLTAEKTLLVITHRTAVLDAVDRVIVLDRGRLVADGPKQAVLSRLKSGVVAGAGT